MVRTLNVTLDDSDFERAKSVKEELNLTWPEYIREATEALAEQGQSD
jgi:methionine synthase I (cobalamin-dependent)